MTETDPPTARKRNRVLVFYAGGALVAVVVAVLIATVLAGDDDAGTKATATAAVGAGTAVSAVVVDITATDFQFDESAIEVPANGPVTVNFKNAGNAPHSIQFRTAKGGGELTPGATGPVTQAGGAATVTFTTPGLGAYYFECVIHPGAMNGTLTVAGGGAVAPTATTTPIPPSTAAASAVAVDVTATDFKFDKSAIEVPANGPVTVSFKNGGNAPHSIQFRTAKGGGELTPGATGPVTQAGGTAAVTFTAPSAGAYYYECVIHPGAMNGTLTVAATAASPTATPVPTSAPTAPATTAPTAAAPTATRPAPTTAPTTVPPPPTATVAPPTPTRTPTAAPTLTPTAAPTPTPTPPYVNPTPTVGS